MKRAPNEFESLHILEKGGRYLWALHDSDRETNWYEIPESLYKELLKHALGSNEEHWQSRGRTGPSGWGNEAEMDMTTHEMIAATIKLLESLHRDCLKRSRAARARTEGSK